MHLPEVTFLAVLLWGMHVECLLRNIFAFHTFFSTSLWASSSFQGTEPDLTEIKLKPVNWLLNVFLVSLVTRSSSVLGSNASWLWRLAFFFFFFPKPLYITYSMLYSAPEHSSVQKLLASSRCGIFHHNYVSCAVKCGMPVTVGVALRGLSLCLKSLLFEGECLDFHLDGIWCWVDGLISQKEMSSERNEEEHNRQWDGRAMRSTGGARKLHLVGRVVHSAEDI